MNYVTLLLAYRYMRGTAYDNTISWMVRICFLAIMIGSFALTLVHAIMHGYEQEIHKKMQGIHAQIIIRSPDALDVDAITNHIHADFPEVIAISPSSAEYAIVRTTHHDSMPTVVLLKGVNPELERLTSCIEQKITSCSTNLSSCIYENTVLIGHGLAQQLMVSVGDSLELLYSENTRSTGKRITMDTAPIIVGGIFKTGIDEFDSGVIYCSYDLLRQLFQDQEISTMNIKLAPYTDERKTIHALQQSLALNVYSWKDLYPALVSALKLEKYAMFLILLLITLVASLNIISLLFMYITQKRTDIAILYTLGASHSLIMAIFTSIGMCIAGTACISGIALAWIACSLLNHYPFIELPDAYYVTHLPAIMDWPLVFLVFCAVMLLSLCATGIIAYRTKNICIAQVLKFEG
jgi:lipoprotein-releasing system permease protein